MYLGDVDGALTFTIDTGHISPFLITLRPWSQGLQPLHLLSFPLDHRLCEKIGCLWKTPLVEIRKQVTPEAWALWASELPEGLLHKLQKLELDNVGSLFLLANIPVLHEALVVPVFFRCLCHRFGGAVCLENFKISMTELMDMPWGQRLGVLGGGDLKPMSRLMLKFLKCIPGNYRIRDFGMGKGVITDLSPYLPHFFNSRLRFRQRWEALSAFHYAAGFSRIDDSVMQALFYRVLKSGEKIRFNNMVLLLQRLKHTANALGKPSIDGVLQGAPSVRFLEKYLRRQERLLKMRLDNAIMLSPQPFPPEFPDAGLDKYPCIEPLLTSASLEQEGDYMSNCIATFEAGIRSGENAAFRLSWPVRCTVLLEKDGDAWALSDARTFHDAKIKADARKTLYQWLQGKPLEKAQGVEAPFVADSLRCIGYWEILYSSAAEEELQEFEDQDEYDPFPEEDDNYFEETDQPNLADYNSIGVVADELDGNNIDPWLSEMAFQPADWKRRSVGQLPDRIGRWVRVFYVEQFHEAGFDDDMFTPIMTAALGWGDFGTCIYLHPDIPLRYAIIHDNQDPENSLELVHVNKPWVRPADITVLRRFDELRQSLRREILMACA